MNRTKNILSIVAALSATVSCYNGGISFSDFDYQTVYFPYQYPVRTLSLGNDIVDNSLDRAHEFNIAVCIGGYYGGNSRKDWTIGYSIDESLVGTSLYNQAGKQLKVLPEEYYTLSPSGSVTIRKGSSNGLIRVKLEDGFFEDPSALDGSYVIPVKITSAPDPLRLIEGEKKAGVSTPSIHSSEDWEVLPMDYTLFGVKYVNKMHGNWLRRGCITERDSKGEIVSESVYHAQYVEYDQVVNLCTASLQAVTTTFTTAGNEWTLTLEDDGAGCLAVTSTAGSKTAVYAGIGEYSENAEHWGGTPENPQARDAIYLNYYYKNNGNTCEVCDTLVFRDRGITLEVARPEIR